MAALTKILLPEVKRTKKPPKKTDILRAQEKEPELKQRDWKSIKYRTWALFQKIDRVAKKLLG